MSTRTPRTQRASWTGATLRRPPRSPSHSGPRRRPDRHARRDRRRRRLRGRAPRRQHPGRRARHRRRDRHRRRLPRRPAARRVVHRPLLVRRLRDPGRSERRDRGGPDADDQRHADDRRDARRGDRRGRRDHRAPTARSACCRVRARAAQVSDAISAESISASGASPTRATPWSA